MASSWVFCQSFPGGVFNSFRESAPSLPDYGDLSRKGTQGTEIFGKFNEVGGCNWKVETYFCKIEKDIVAWRKTFHMQLLKRPTCHAMSLAT